MGTRGGWSSRQAGGGLVPTPALLLREELSFHSGVPWHVLGAAVVLTPITRFVWVSLLCRMEVGPPPLHQPDDRKRILCSGFMVGEAAPCRGALPSPFLLPHHHPAPHLIALRLGAPRHSYCREPEAQGKRWLIKHASQGGITACKCLHGAEWLVLGAAPVPGFRGLTPPCPCPGVAPGSQS